MPKVQRASLFYRNKRVGEMQKVTYSIKSNDGQEIADNGVYNTDGVTTTEVSCEVIVPVKGVSVSVVEDAINHNDVDLMLGIVDGKLHTIKEARNTEIEFQSEVASGKLSGSFKWHGGPPKISSL